MSFEKLLSDLAQATTEQEALSKALPADDGTDDKKIQAAAEEGGSGDGKSAEGDADNKGDGDDKDKPMAKSFKVTMPDGTEVDAEDGTELVKALNQRLDANEAELGKAFAGVIGLLKGQAEMIKSLSEQVKKLGGEGRGRKAMVTISEKKDVTTPLAKSEAKDGLTGEQFMAKAMSAQKEGRINGFQVSLAEACLNKGQEIPADIVQRVLQ